MDRYLESCSEKEDLCNNCCPRIEKGYMVPKCFKSLKAKEAPSSGPFSDGLEGPLEERKEWIDIEKKTPEIIEPYDHSRLILVTDSRLIWIDTYWKNGGWSEHAAWSQEDPVTHWMELPELPKAA